jgi:hypothetical protein
MPMESTWRSRDDMEGRSRLLGETDAYLAELLAEIGEPSAEERARAEAIARRIASRQTPRTS